MRNFIEIFRRFPNDLFVDLRFISSVPLEEEKDRRKPRKKRQSNPQPEEIIGTKVGANALTFEGEEVKENLAREKESAYSRPETTLG